MSKVVHLYPSRMSIDDLARERLCSMLVDAFLRRAQRTERVSHCVIVQFATQLEAEEFQKLLARVKRRKTA